MANPLRQMISMRARSQYQQSPCDGKEPPPALSGGRPCSEIKINSNQMSPSQQPSDCSDIKRRRAASSDAHSTLSLNTGGKYLPPWDRQLDDTQRLECFRKDCPGELMARIRTQFFLEGDDVIASMLKRHGDNAQSTVQVLLTFCASKEGNDKLCSYARLIKILGGSPKESLCSKGSWCDKLIASGNPMLDKDIDFDDDQLTPALLAFMNDALPWHIRLLQGGKIEQVTGDEDPVDFLKEMTMGCCTVRGLLEKMRSAGKILDSSSYLRFKEKFGIQDKTCTDLSGYYEIWPPLDNLDKKLLHSDSKSNVKIRDALNGGKYSDLKATADGVLERMECHWDVAKRSQFKLELNCIEMVFCSGVSSLDNVQDFHEVKQQILKSGMTFNDFYKICSDHQPYFNNFLEPLRGMFGIKSPDKFELLSIFEFRRKLDSNQGNEFNRIIESIKFKINSGNAYNVAALNLLINKFGTKFNSKRDGDCQKFFCMIEIQGVTIGALLKELLDNRHMEEQSVRHKSTIEKFRTDLGALYNTMFQGRH
ncbi:hypothetical protein [Endozoicomonas sp.]|uniref:hypothetical protein n=1 Tax=Endozoicomonas sp. TaxID=1892382 RepID=UPI00288403D1|nr:hypothetical protein [Endozoicomonas sp.]